MRIPLINTILFISVILSGCATAYKPVGLFTGGYSEEKFSNDLYTIRFKGNDNTSIENAVEKAMLRASEVGKMSGFKYFVVVKNNSSAETSYYRTPETTTTTGTITAYAGVANMNAVSQTTGGEIVSSVSPTASLLIRYYTENDFKHPQIFGVESTYEYLSKKYIKSKGVIAPKSEKDNFEPL